MSASVVAVWDDWERAAWAVPQRLRPSQWAEKYRVLSRGPFKGPWRNENGPALVVLMDLAARGDIRRLGIKKANQVGGSEISRNVLGWSAMYDPAPALVVLPNENDGKKIFSKNLLPLFSGTEVEAFAQLDTGKKRDKKLRQITLANGFELTLGYSGSSSSLASDPYKRVVLDETDKYVPFVGADGSPIDLAAARVKKFEDESLILLISTPTSSSGTIAVEFSRAPIQLFHFVPCPHCGQFQILTHAQLRWEKLRRPDGGRFEPHELAAKIRARKAAWIECCSPTCGKRIVESDKRTILWKGYWATKDGGWKIFADGHEEGVKPEGDTVFAHLPAFYDLHYKWHQMAAKFVAAEGSREKLQDYYNNDLGEEFADPTVSLTVNVFSAKCRPDEERGEGFTPPKARLIAPWASRLVMAVDTQLDHFYYVIRAFGPRLRSHRVDHGRVLSFEQIEELFYGASWRYDGEKFPAMRCCDSAPLGIDSGGGLDRDEQDATRTDQVYQWCLKDPMRRFPLKGSSKPLEYPHFRWRDVTYKPKHQKHSPYVVRLWFVDPVHWRDLLAGYITASLPVIDAQGEVAGHEDQWLLNDVDDPAYNAQLAAMHRVREVSGRKYSERWKPKTPGARHDYHDICSYILFLAHGPAQCQALMTPEQVLAAQRGMGPPVSGGIRMPDGRPFLATKR